MATELARLSPRRERDLPPAIPDEIRPRREHFLRLLYVGLAGLPVAFGMSLVVGTGDELTAPGALLSGAATGYLAGQLHARWLWKGTMPARMWAPWSALGWALGMLLLAGSAHWLDSLDGSFGPFSDLLLLQLALLGCGAVAGGVSGIQQARVLRWRDLDWGWWVAVNAGATALGWMAWLLVDWTGNGTRCF